MQAKSKILTLEQLKDKHYGKRGAVKREKLEKGYQEFKMGKVYKNFVHVINPYVY